MQNNFQLLSVTEKLINYINKVLPNFPKKEVVLRSNMEKNMYDLMASIFAFNIQTSMRIRQKYLKDFLVLLSMLDFYVRQSYQKKYISNRQLECIGRMLIESRKIAYGLARMGEVHDV